MAHTIRGKKSLLDRIRRIQGQTEGLKKALETESECIAILQQIAAIRGAVNGLMVEVLEGHIRDHLSSEATSAAQRGDALEQVVMVLRSYLK